MTAHLLVLSLGPVQEFIAAARRTRDLWFGSHLLSEISKAAARAVKELGGTLIFPAIDNDRALELDPESEFNVANIVLAQLAEGCDPRDMAVAARNAAEACWRRYADTVFNQYRSLIKEDIWEDQVEGGDMLEFFAVWVSHRPESYRHDRARLMRLLDGRKACRDFRQAKGRAGVPKSSLDGLRESVLKEGSPVEPSLQRELRLAEGEQLDVIGLVKRAGAGKRPYPSVERVAADPWLRGLREEDRRLLREKCDEVNSAAGWRAIHRIDESYYPQYADFPFEGTAVFRSRHRELFRDAALSKEDLKPLSDELGKVIMEAGEPSPYLSVLVADGDRIGETLSKFETPHDHQCFSRLLSRFAGEVRRIIHDHRGVLVYAGGDDVLAFVPVDHCLGCARDLREAFRDVVRRQATQTGAEVTLSVGLAIAHFMENLEDLLDYGRTAEKHAKNPGPEDGGQEKRDGLAVHLLKRGGAPIRVRANWIDKLDQRLTEMAHYLCERTIPGRVAGDLRRLARVYDGWPAELVGGAIQDDAFRVLSAKRPRVDGALDKVWELVRQRVSDSASLRRLADELLVARQIGVALRQAGEKSSEGRGSR